MQLPAVGTDHCALTFAGGGSGRGLPLELQRHAGGRHLSIQRGRLGLGRASELQAAPPGGAHLESVLPTPYFTAISLHDDDEHLQYP